MTAVATGELSLAAAHDEVDALLAAELSLASTDELLDSWRDLERLRNRLAAVEHRLVVEAESRGLPFEFSARDVAGLIRGLLRVHPREAAGRVRAAEAAAGRVTVTGEPVAAPFPRVAAAQAEGAISPRHAAVITQCVDHLPDEVQVEHGARVEADLVGFARDFDPHELGRLAARTRALLDQDGALCDVALRERQRVLSIRQRPDGSASITGEATAELAERLLTIMDSLARPRPAEDGTRDPRTAGQRQHDALLDALGLVQRAELLPDAAGVTATVLLTMPAGAWATGDGVAVTGHGAVLPAAEAVRIAGGQARVMTIRTDRCGTPTGWTDARRLFTETQRLVIAARDGGCSFPGCDTPPLWCQVNHVVPWAKGGRTEIDNGALMCGYHHRSFEAQGWTAVMINNRPGYLPPPWIDPEQKPRFGHRIRT